MGRLIPAGTGLAFHEERKRARQGDISKNQELEDLLGGSGGIETVFTALTVHAGIIPPTINLDNPDKECDLDYVPKVARRADVKAAMTNSFGFGGTNAALILKQYPS